MYLAYDVSLGRLLARDGTTYAITDATGNVIPFQDHGASMPASVRMPSNRNLYLLYRMTGEIRQVTMPYTGEMSPALHVVTAEPVVMLPGEVIDKTFVGTWEGTTNARKADGSFSPDEVRIRITFTSATSMTNLKIWETGTSLSDGTRFKLVGKIENFSKAVKGSDGTCYPALTSLAEKNPFNGAHLGDVDMYRLAGMHYPGDQVLVFTLPAQTSDWSVTAMGGLGPFGPADWISTKGWSELALDPHGLPKGNRIKLHLSAAAGGDDC